MLETIEGIIPIETVDPIPRDLAVPRELAIPRDLADNLFYRSQILTEVKSNPKLQEALLLRCKEDVKFFFNTFLYTYDPRVAPFSLPFITYDYEDKAIDWLMERVGLRDGLIDKTRDMGVTWTILGVFYHQWLFGEGFLAHVGSKTEDDVDRTGDMKSLFEKLRFFIKTTPAWMLPSYDIRFMRLINARNGNSITGESANSNFARSGRYRICLYDEFAVTEYAEDIWTAMGDSSPSRIVVGTPAGTGNKFWKLRFKEMPAQDLLSLHWTLHPKKALGLYEKDGKQRSPWYDAECLRRSPAEVAQELDIDYLASGNPFFDLKAVTLQKEWVEGEIAGMDASGVGKFVKGLLAKVEGKVTFRPNRNGVIKVFEYPGPLTQACVGVDPAEGLEHGDNTAIAVRCKKTGNLLACAYGKITPDEAGNLALLLSQYYNGALAAAEMGGYGLVINQYLWDKGGNVFRDLDTAHGGEKEGSKLGFNTKRHRDEMLQVLEEEIRNKAIEMRDRDLKCECLNFINKNGKPKAAVGSCDDFIFAFGICGMLMYWYPYSKKVERSVIGHGIQKHESKPNMGFGFQKGESKRRF